MWDPQAKHSLKTALDFLLPFFFKIPCTYFLGLRTHPNKSIHVYCWRDKFQWKGITVALEKLVLSKLSHSSGKLHLLVFISDPQNCLVWKTGILEDILLPGCAVFSKFSFSINYNPAILEDLLCLFFCYVAPLRRILKKNCLKKTSCLTCCHYPSRSQDNTCIKAKHLKFRWLNGSRKSAAVDKQGLPERETEGLQSTATLSTSPGASRREYNRVTSDSCQKQGGEGCRIFMYLKSHFLYLLVPSVGSYRQILLKYQTVY